MKVLVFNKQKALKLNLKRLPAIVKTVLDLEDCVTDEVNLHFVTTSVISTLHEEYFSDPTTTDCISFPIDGPEKTDGHHVLGEVFTCPQTAIDYCKKHGGDPAQETTLYLVHGLLHLLGYDDLSEKEKRKMRTAEKRHMRNLNERGLSL